MLLFAQLGIKIYIRTFLVIDGISAGVMFYPPSTKDVPTLSKYACI
jgi:hypothetical protein